MGRTYNASLASGDANFLTSPFHVHGYMIEYISGFKISLPIKTMRLTSPQIDTIAKYLADVSKILIGSVVVGFFVPTSTGPISIPVFLAGSLMALLTLGGSIQLTK